MNEPTENQEEEKVEEDEPKTVEERLTVLEKSHKKVLSALGETLKVMQGVLKKLEEAELEKRVDLHELFTGRGKRE